MSRLMLTGNGAAAWGARLAKVDYIPAFPITPQTEIIETLAKWVDEKAMNSRYVTLESEHSMVTAAGAAAVTGVRTFTASSSQGLLYALEMMYSVAGWRAPLVMINVSRGLSAPITLEPDHNDILAARDCGFLQIHCATCQEVVDQVLIAYRLAEDPLVRLPVLVNLDGFYLSFTREPVILPDAQKAKEFVGPFDSENFRFSSKFPVSQAVAVLGGVPYSYFKYQAHLASQQALEIYHTANEEFKQYFSRSYPPLECFQTDDADYIFYMIGSFATKAKAAVQSLRAKGMKIGLVRPRLIRPFPVDDIRNAFKGKKAVAVIDQNISIGKGGILYSELCSALYGEKDMPPILANFISGLGGRDISQQEFDYIAHRLKQCADKNHVPKHSLMFTEQELQQVKQMQSLAHSPLDATKTEL